MDDQAINELGQDAALDLAVEREKLTRQLEDETALTKASKGAISDLTDKRQKLLEELEKQGPLVDYSATLEEHQKALIERLKAQAESAQRVADANKAQAEEITKQTSTIRKQGSATGSTFKRVSKETTLAGNVANKMIKGVSSMISAQVDSFLNEIPMVPEARQAAGFVKSVMPTKGKDKDKEKPEKHIQTASQRDREKAAPQPIATAPAPSTALPAPTVGHKKADTLSGKMVYRKLDAITDELTKVNEGVKAIHNHLIMKAIMDLVMKAGLFSGIGTLVSLFKKVPSMLSPKPAAGQKPQTSGKPDPKAAPKKGDTKSTPNGDQKKGNPKADPNKPQTKPLKGDKEKPHAEPTHKQDLPKGEPTKGPTSEPKPKPSSTPKPAPSGSTTPKPSSAASTASKVGGTISKVGKFARGIPYLGTMLTVENVAMRQYNDDRNVGLGHAQAIMHGNQNSYKGDYRGTAPAAPAMQPAEPPISAEGEKLDAQIEEKQKQEKAKADLETQARMAQAISVGGSTTVNTINTNVSGSGSSNSVIQPFGNEYQTPNQRGSMIQR